MTPKYLILDKQVKKLQLGKGDIPAEFKISEYKKCASWGLKEWTDALSFRHAMRSAWNGINSSHSVLSIMEENSRGSFYKELKGYLQDDSKKLFNDTSYACMEHLSLYNLFTARYSEKRSLIREQTAADCFQFEWEFIYESPRYAEWVKRSAYLKKTGMSDNMSEELTLEWKKFFGTPAWKMHTECSKSGSSIPIHQMFIGVDLCAPDDILVKDFKSWLKQIRKNTELPSITNEFNNEDFADWHTERLLPFLDLTFWATMHDKEINYDEIGKALYPCGDKSATKEAINILEQKGDGERIKRTIEPYALRLVSDRYVSALKKALARKQ